MAIVFLARDLRHERAVALKVLRPELAATLGPERFLNEIKLAAGLAHPHIVPLYESGDADGLLFYAMPYVEGESLRDLLIREGRLSLETTLAIGAEIADALAYAHERGIVHRDVKPENILLEAGHAVVSDFGIARAISAAGAERVTATGLAVGTPEYMSPEQAYGAPGLDGRADIYALGCVLYESLTGRPPAGGTSPGGHHTPPPRAIRTGLGRVQPAVPPAIVESMVRALAEDPKDRFATATDFYRALTTADVRSSPVKSRAWALGAGALAIAAVTTAWLIFRGPGQENAGSVGPTPLDPTHIAVLYFEDAADRGRLTPIAAGITEDLIDELSQVHGLRVISPMGVRPFHGGNATTDSVARTLGVGTIVTGSLAQSRGRVRVTVRLVDGRTSEELHSQTFVRLVGDLFALQDSLGDDISRFLRQRLGEAVELRRGRSGTQSLAAWTLYQQGQGAQQDGREVFDQGDVRTASTLWSRAESLYVLAQSQDPRWPAPPIARGWLALAQANAVSTGTTPSYVDWLRKGLVEAEQAVRIAAAEPRALALRGRLRMELGFLSDTSGGASLRDAEADLRAALGLDPNLAQAWFALGELLHYTGNLVEGELATRRAYEADAYLLEARAVVTSLFFSGLNLEHFDDARAWCEVGRQRWPQDINIQSCRLRLIGWTGHTARDVAAAWAEVAGLEHSTPPNDEPLVWEDRRLMVAAAAARAGLRDSTIAMLARTRGGTDSTARSELADEEAWVWLLLGERAHCLALLAEYTNANPASRRFIAASPWFRTLHGSAEFEALVRL